MITQHQHTYPWGAVIWAALLLAALPVIVAIAVSVGIGVVAGFQTRGDPVAIDAAVQGLATAVWYQATPEIILALVAFQRGIHFARFEADAILAFIGAALLALALQTTLALTVFGAGQHLWLSLVVDAVIMVAMGWLGIRLARQAHGA